MKNITILLFIVLLFLFKTNTLTAQIRQVFVDKSGDDAPEVVKISFYSPNEGYVAFKQWLGFSTDSGHTFVKKYITNSNVNYNGYSANLTFGFGIKGVIAFDKNNLIVYGDYGLVPAILASSNGGDSFKLVFHSQFGTFKSSNGIQDIKFPQKDNVGYAVDYDRVLKTIDKGATWTVVKTDVDAYFENLETVDNNNVLAISNHKVLKTINGGDMWQTVALPTLNTPFVDYIYFLDANKGWLNISAVNNKGYLYKTTNGGATWVLQNDVNKRPFRCYKMTFVSDLVGFALVEQNLVYKTTNSGVNWEPIARDNNFKYLGYTYNDIQIFSPTHFWVGGYGSLELSANGGGVTIPKAYFSVDTTGYYNNGKIKLYNDSKSGYQSTWIVNKNQTGNQYNIDYTHNIDFSIDTITLINFNGVYADTLKKTQSFPLPIIINSFSPTSAPTGTQITINGKNFFGAKAIYFGGFSASSFTVINDNKIIATVGQGASGAVKVANTLVQGNLDGFIYLPPPKVNSFDPNSGKEGDLVTIKGENFNNVSKVSFGDTSAISYIVISSTEIKTVVPSGSSGLVKVSSSTGIGSLTGFISLPVISSFTPVKGTFGTIMEIYGSSLSDISSINLGGFNVNSFKINSSKSITAVVGSGGTGSVTVNKTQANFSKSGFNWYPNPIIDNVNPYIGKVGDTILITGNNFDNNFNNNFVFFGKVKAKILSGTSSSLKVVVPIGASFDFISVTSNNLIAKSGRQFHLTFPDGGILNKGSFIRTTNIQTDIGDLTPGMLYEDFDGDGKIDIISILPDTNSVNENFYTKSLCAFINIGNKDSLKFKKSFSIPFFSPFFMIKDDFDGDGKIDIITTYNEELAFLRNTSTLGNISFELTTSYLYDNFDTKPYLSDLDGDGKIDLVIDDYIYRNISNPGNIKFEKAYKSKPFYGDNNSNQFMDLNGDKKMDVISHYYNDEFFKIAVNTSQKGKISFADPIHIEDANPLTPILGDINNDGIVDIVASGNNISVFKNISTPSQIIFDKPYVISNLPSDIKAINLSDMDGDGKLDIIIYSRGKNIGILKNLSTSTNISFADPVFFENVINTERISVVDINGDGKYDIITSEYDKPTFYINNVSKRPYIESFSPAIGIKDSILQIVGSNLLEVNEVKFGGIAATSFKINSNESITAVVGNGASGEVEVRNNVGSGFLAGFLYATPPKITKISPTSGIVGTIVTIEGINFKNTLTGNVVKYGGVNAEIIEANNNSIKVKVPTGPVNESFTVTVDSLTAYSSQLFNFKFPSAETRFTKASFDEPLIFPDILPNNYCDLDGDGKLDILSIKDKDITVFKNTGTATKIAFDEKFKFTSEINLTSSAFGDFNGDGKIDIVLVGTNDNSITIFKNNSQNGNVFLTAENVYKTGASTTKPNIAFVSDIDQDGRPDIVVSNIFTKNIAVFKNVSSKNKIAFTDPIFYSIGSEPTDIQIKDLNGDQLPDILISTNGTIKVFLNFSLPNKIILSNILPISTSKSPSQIHVADIDNDGKLDMISPNSNYISIFRNLTTPQNTLQTDEQEFVNNKIINKIALSDLDGDGNIDILNLNEEYGDEILLLKNNSISGEVKMLSPFSLTLDRKIYNINSRDLDNDGKPEIILTYLTGTLILKNTTATKAIYNCQGTSSTASSNLSGSSYQWQLNSGASFIKIENDATFTNTSTKDLKINTPTNTYNNYKIRCLVDGNFSETSKLIITPIEASSISIYNNITTICEGTTATFNSGLAKNIGETQTYNWRKNGISVGENKPVYTDSDLKNGDEIDLVLTHDGICTNLSVLTSNKIKMTVNPSNSSIQISGKADVKPFESSTITAIVKDAGDRPNYIWQDSTKTHGWETLSFGSQASLKYYPNTSGDKLRCVVVSSSNCSYDKLYYSNTISFNVEIITAIENSKLASDIKYYPNPVDRILYIESNQDNTVFKEAIISSLSGVLYPKLKTTIIKNKIAIDVNDLKPGSYLVIIKNKEKIVKTIKFVKL